jgi:hypothetical protein
MSGVVADGVAVAFGEGGGAGGEEEEEFVHILSIGCLKQNCRWNGLGNFRSVHRRRQRPEYPK